MGTFEQVSSFEHESTFSQSGVRRLSPLGVRKISQVNLKSRTSESVMRGALGLGWSQSKTSRSSGVAQLAYVARPGVFGQTIQLSPPHCYKSISWFNEKIDKTVSTLFGSPGKFLWATPCLHPRAASRKSLSSTLAVLRASKASSIISRWQSV
jgi:hypothetical protein